jgi:hypothetical protein
MPLIRDAACQAHHGIRGFISDMQETSEETKHSRFISPLSRRGRKYSARAPEIPCTATVQDLGQLLLLLRPAPVPSDLPSANSLPAISITYNGA